MTQTRMDSLTVEKSQRALDLDLSYIKSIYTRLIVKKALKGDDVSLLVERLKAVEIQIWGMKTAKNITGRKTQSNG
jgi:hypothetical protein